MEQDSDQTVFVYCDSIAYKLIVALFTVVMLPSLLGFMGVIVYSSAFPDRMPMPHKGPDLGIWGVLVSLSAGILLLSYLSYAFGQTVVERFALLDDGLEHRSWYGRKQFFKYGEIEASEGYAYGVIPAYVIRSGQQTINIQQRLMGYRDFIAKLEARIPKKESS